MLNVDASIDYVNVNALSPITVILIFGKCAESQFGTMADPSETLDKTKGKH